MSIHADYHGTLFHSLRECFVAAATILAVGFAGESNRMEQQDRLYEFRMGMLTYRFEAPGRSSAEKFRELARLHFREILNGDYLESRMEGPFEIRLLNDSHQLPFAA